jgi:hypothetical protein
MEKTRGTDMALMDFRRTPQRTRSFEPGSTLLPVGHKCFGELLPFLDILHYCSLSNLHFYYFCQNQYVKEMVRLHGEEVDCSYAQDFAQLQVMLQVS